MDQDHRVNMGIVYAGAILGIVGDLLFQGAAGLGLNAVGWAVALTAAIRWILRVNGTLSTGDGRFFMIPALAFPLCMVWRDSSTLHALDLAATLCALALWSAYAVSGQATRCGFWQYVRAFFDAAGSVMIGCPIVLTETRWTSRYTVSEPRSGGPVLRGIAIAAPLVLLFGTLFANADPVFAHYTGSLLDWNFYSTIERAFWIIGAAWVSIGCIRYALNRADTIPDSESTSGAGYLGGLELSIALGALDLLFLCFVLIQIRYLFGGAELVNRTIGMTFADYARTGFFELAAASALVLPVLTLIHWAMDRTDARAVRLYRILAGIQILLLFVVMGSAMQRMHLYEVAFGLTELRVYTVAFMGWLAIVFVWMAASMFRGRPERFVFGASMAAFAVLLCLHAWNPDARIASTNARLSMENKSHRFDACYAGGLSADAAPALTAVLPYLDPATQSTVASDLLRWSPPRNIDWRTWNIGKALAWNVSQEHAVQLRLLAKNTPPDACASDTD